MIAALPPGVNLDDLRGPWMLDVADVKFETDTRGRQRILGSGSFGIVFAGTYCDEPAAIKQMLDTTADDVNAWLKEVQLQYRIRVDGVLAVHGALLDLDDADKLLCYIVMQRVPGSMESLVLTAGGALTGAGIYRRIHWLRQAAVALAALHARKIIHTDVKPANIMLSSVVEAEAAVRVADFGTALVRNPIAGTKTTHKGERGSMIFMDPALFDGGSVTAASDTYSWAITAWQVLAGRVPYAAELAASEALALDALRRHVCGVTGQRPSVAVLAERGVPGAVIDVIQRCWAADPAARPTMADVAAALAAPQTSGFLGGPPEPPVPAVAPTLLMSVPAMAVPLPVERLAAEMRAALSAHNKTQVVAALMTLARLDSDAQRVEYTQKGAGVAAQDALAGFADEVEVIRVGCRALANLAGAADNRVALVCDGAHAAVIAAVHVHINDVEIARDACGMLWSLTYADDNCDPLVRDNAHIAMMATVQAHAGDLAVARAACATLQNLACAGGLEVPLVRDGAHTAVMAAARAHAGDVEVVRWACGALFNLSTVDDNDVPLVHDGVHLAVIAAMWTHSGDVDVVRRACGTLQNLACAEENKVPLVHDGAHTAAMAAARDHSSNMEVVRRACGALSHLSAADDNCVPLARDGVHVVMLAAARAHVGDVEVARYVCNTLQCLVGGSASDDSVPLMCDGVHTAVMAMMRAHAGDVKVARAASGALRSLAYADGFEVPLVRDGAHMAVMAAARVHGGDVEVARVACGTLKYLAVADGLEVPLVRNGAHVTVMAAAQAHSSDVEVARLACGALQSLSVAGVNRVPLLRDGAHIAVMAVARSHAGDAEVARAANAVVHNLAPEEDVGCVVQ